MAAGRRPPTVPAYHPSRLTHLGDARQVVVVSARDWSSNRAVLRTWQRDPAGGWQLVGEPVPARVGRNGFVLADRRRQNSGTSPAGTFAVVSAFGNGPDPGTALGYRVVDRSDWWTYDPRDPKTYNVLQPRRVATSRVAAELGGGPVGLRRAVPLRGSARTSTCRPACTGRPTASGWPTSPRTPGWAAGSSCT